MPVGDVSGVGANNYANANTNATSKRQGGVDRTSLSMEDFFKLMAAQLQNQDMNNPMSNSEMMTQMTQMAMMQSIDNFSAISTTTYGASMIGKEVVVADVNSTTGAVNGKLTGIVTRVDLYGDVPYLYLDGDNTPIPISYLMSVQAPGTGKPEDPEKPDGGSDGSDGTNKPDGSDGANKPDGSDGTNKPDGSDGAKKSGGPYVK